MFTIPRERKQFLGKVEQKIKDNDGRDSMHDPT